MKELHGSRGKEGDVKCCPLDSQLREMECMGEGGVVHRNNVQGGMPRATGSKVLEVETNAASIEIEAESYLNTICTRRRLRRERPHTFGLVWRLNHFELLGHVSMGIAADVSP